MSLAALTGAGGRCARPASLAAPVGAQMAMARRVTCSAASSNQ